MADDDVLIELAAAVTRLSGSVEVTAQALQKLCEQLGVDAQPSTDTQPPAEPQRRADPQPTGRAVMCMNPRSFALQVIEGGLSTSVPRASPPD